MQVRTIATFILLTYSSSAVVANAQNGPIQFQPRSSAKRASSQNGAVSQDLLQIYQKTKNATTEQSVTAIARACSEVIPDRNRSQVDRDYAASLLAWALNRRGELRSERAAKLVETNQLAEADKLDRQAAEDFETAIEYGPTNWRVHHNLAIALAMKGDYQRGIREFTRAIELKPDYANAYFNRAELYFELEEYGTAADDYSQAIAIEGRDPQYYNSRAHCQFMLEDYRQAVRDYKTAAELGSDSAVYQTDLADAYQYLGKWQDAAQAYRAAVAANNRYPRAYQNAAWLMATCPDPEIRNADLALAAAKKALELSQERSARTLDTLAAAKAAVGKHREAVQIQQQALEVAGADEKEELTQRLRLYQQGHVYRQPKPMSEATSPVDSGELQIRTASNNERRSQ